MANRRTVLSAGAALGAAAAAAGYGIWADRSGSTSSGELGTEEFFPPEQRHDAPAVHGELLDGTAFDLADWRG